MATRRVSTTTTNGIGGNEIVRHFSTEGSCVMDFDILYLRKQSVNCLTFVPELLRLFPDVKLSVIIIIALVI